MERNEESKNWVKFQGSLYVGGENTVLCGPRQMEDFVLLLVSLQSENGNVCVCVCVRVCVCMCVCVVFFLISS